MGDLMARWFQMIAEGGKVGMDVKLIYTKTLTTAYTTTLSSLWTNEIVSQLSFGDYHKGAVVVFEGNTATGSSAGDMLAFSLAVNPASQASNEKTGWMIRKGYAAIRGFDATNDFKVSDGTIMKIYEITM